MARWNSDRERRTPALLSAALAATVALAVVARLVAGDHTGQPASQPATPPPPSVAAESEPPMLMYDVRLALDLMSGQT